MDPNRPGWDRLQTLLEQLKPGDEIEVVTVAQTTGLTADTCVVVLEALTRAELFVRPRAGTFVRRRMLDPIERVHL
jgi:hypothetical protein